MKTAVSVPDDVFESAERLARRERRSRSEVGRVPAVLEKR
jgi:metal-responsive CopG/Arc/MetJ family transcriptional regulator